jgi:hypothetical protein
MHSATSGLENPLEDEMAHGPLFRIVGGMMEASNNTQSEPFLTIKKWGVQTPLTRVVGGSYCWTKQYGDSSYSRLSLYLDSTNQYDMVVGGKILANNNESSNQWVEQSSWGNTGSGTTLIEKAFEGYGWSRAYQQGYVRCDLYTASAPSGPYPTGGRYISNVNDQSAAPVTESFWGFSDGTENEMFGAYNWSSRYQKGYGRVTVFTNG